MTFTDANICDSSGNMLFITDGLSIYGSDGRIINNGDGLNPCPYTSYFIGQGLNIQQAALFIPTPSHTNLYHLFHFSNDTANESRPGTLYYSQVDNSTGVGNVILKNIPFCISMFREGGITACKHANGRDYWIVMAGLANNRFYKFLLTPDTLLGPFTQDIGPMYPGPYDLAYSKFSQDGSRYATGAFEGLVTVMDFDRCTGEFSTPLTIYNDASIDTLNPTTGCVSLEFSPNGRFLYVGDRIIINQFDLQAANIQDSVEIYRTGPNDLAQTDMLQLAANGKLYISTWNGGVYYCHVINQPDSLGDSCHFIYGGLPTLTINSNKVPNMINYKLGPLIGSGCDTINTSSFNLAKDSELIRIIPNPANKYAYVEIGTPGDYEFQLLNETGQLLSAKQTRQVDIFDTENLSNGVYFLKVVDRKNPDNTMTRKIVVQH
ncbi:MAG: Protein of unknown function precursor [Bacteroidota bacterium]|nr:Protein of unknown function precursor [Bacteroidota bacterium]